MPRESIKSKRARVKRIIALLQKTYPDAHCELNHSNPLELLIATILSAQCTDKRVNLVTAGVFKKNLSAKDFSEAPPAGLEQTNQTTGFFPNKARKIKARFPGRVGRPGGAGPPAVDEHH